MSTTSHPQIQAALIAADQVVSIADRHDLITGTKATGASATVDTLIEDLQDKTQTELNTLFAPNSDIRNRIQQFLDSNGGHSKLSAKVIAEAGGAAAATGEITPTGLPTEDGVLTISLVGKEQFSAEVAISSGESLATITAAITAAFTSSIFPFLPVAVTDGTTVVDVASIDLSTAGNNYKIGIEGEVAGLTMTITPMAGGSGIPSTTTFFDNLTETRFTGINWPTSWESNVSDVISFLDGRFDSVNAIRDGVAFLGVNDTFALNKARSQAENSQSIVFGGNTTEIFQPADWALSFFQGVRSKRLTPDAPISNNIVTVAGASDNFGGISLASLPYFNTPLPQLAVADPNNLYNSLEQAELEREGFTVFGTNNAQNGMVMGAVVTTRNKDGAGNLNTSFLYLNFVDTGSVCREFFFNNLKSRFVQSRLTSGDLVAGRSIENEESIRVEFIKTYKQLSNLALTIKGSDAEKFFNDNLSITVNQAARKVTSLFQLPIVSQLAEMVFTAQLNFNLEG